MNLELEKSVLGKGKFWGRARFREGHGFSRAVKRIAGCGL
jgi:hypothetical protein